MDREQRRLAVRPLADDRGSATSTPRSTSARIAARPNSWPFFQCSRPTLTIRSGRSAVPADSSAALGRREARDVDGVGDDRVRAVAAGSRAAARAPRCPRRRSAACRRRARPRRSSGVLEPVVVDVVAAEADDGLGARQPRRRASGRARACRSRSGSGPGRSSAIVASKSLVGWAHGDAPGPRAAPGKYSHWSLLLRLQTTCTSQPRRRRPRNFATKNVSENFGKWSVTITIAAAADFGAGVWRRRRSGARRVRARTARRRRGSSGDGVVAALEVARAARAGARATTARCTGKKRNQRAALPGAPRAARSPTCCRPGLVAGAGAALGRGSASAGARPGICSIASSPRLAIEDGARRSGTSSEQLVARRAASRQPLARRGCMRARARRPSGGSSARARSRCACAGRRRPVAGRPAERDRRPSADAAQRPQAAAVELLAGELQAAPEDRLGLCEQLVVATRSTRAPSRRSTSTAAQPARVQRSTRLALGELAARSRSGICVPPVAAAEPSGGSTSEPIAASASRTMWMNAPREQACRARRRRRGARARSRPSGRALSPTTRGGGRAARAVARTRSPRDGAPVTAGSVRRRDSRDPAASTLSRQTAGCWPSAQASALAPERSAPTTKIGRGGRRVLRAGGRCGRGRGRRRLPAACSVGPASERSPTGGGRRARRSGRAPRRLATSSALRLRRAHSISMTRWRSGDLRPVAGAVVSEP